MKNKIVEEILNKRYCKTHNTEQLDEIVSHAMKAAEHLFDSPLFYSYIKSILTNLPNETSPLEFNPLEEPTIVKTTGQQYSRPPSMTYTRVPGFQLSRASTIA